MTQANLTNESLIKPEQFLEDLRACGIDFFCGVPDSLLKELLAHMQNTLPAQAHRITASEGAAVALAAGYYLGSGKPALVYLQNSGLGNAVNPLMSLTHDQVYNLPLLLVVGHRGEPATKDEPQHKAMGNATLAMLETMAIPYFKLKADTPDPRAIIEAALARVKEISGPVAIVVSAGTFAKAPAAKSLTANIAKLSRDQVLETLLTKLSADKAIVASTGFNGRVLFAARQKTGTSGDLDFLNVGAMGHSLPLAIGIALGAQKEIICLDGDGSLLMHLGSLLTAGASGAPVRHLVLNNSAHESVGGQPTGAENIDFSKIALASGFKSAHKMLDNEDLDTAIGAFLAAPTPAFLEVPTKLGTQSDLPRPSSDFKGSRDAFIKRLREAKKEAERETK